jgi:hypothetical protein
MSNYVKFNRGLSKSQFKLYVKNSNTIIITYPSGDRMIFYEPHTSGNVDVHLEGLLLIPQITSSADVSGTSNLPDGSFDYKSGYYNSNTGIFTPENLAQRSCTHIEVQFTLPNDSVIQIRTY